MLDILLLALLGVVVGVATGLTPGLHVNTVSLLGLGVYSQLGFDPLQFSVFMVSMSVTHAFLDYIPSIFLGVPEEETALSVLPAHQLVLSGRAVEAVKLTCYGSILGVGFSVALLPAALLVLPAVYHWLRPFVVYLISAAALALILRERGLQGKFLALLAFALSGVLGLLTLNMPGISATHVLFPVFAGLFGISSILHSLSERRNMVPQEPYGRVRVDGEVLGGGFFGALGGMVVGILPAMSPSQVGILISPVFGSTQRGFLVSISAISSSDAIYSLVSTYTIQNPRSGVAVFVSRILDVDLPTVLLFIGVFCFATFAAAAIQIRVGMLAARHVTRIDYKLLSTLTLVLVASLLLALTGPVGLLVALASTAIGLLPILSGVSRTHLMGVLMVPTILYFVGLM